PFEGVQVQVLATSKRFPNDILLAINKDNRALHDVYQLDLAKGELTKVLENPGFMVLPGLGSFVVDYDLKVRGATKPRPDGGLDILIRESDKGEWKTAVSFGLDETIASNVQRFSADGKSLFLISSQESDKAALVKLDLETQKSEVLSADPDYDTALVVFNPDTWEPQLAAVPKDRVDWKVLDPSIDVEVKTLLDLHPGEMNLLGRDHADKTWLVGFSPDVASPAYYSFDRSSGKATFLFEAKPELSKYSLANVEHFEYQSRDGLTIHGYLTFPVGSDLKNLPTIIHPHGGPWGRDLWGYNPMVQWMANRGYLVVQMNFRGSTGYGKDFLNAGDLEWGAKMQDDITDSVDYVVGKGFADPKRLVILGGSYGGYATLAGATFTPDLFCCAVDIVGPSNLITFLESISPLLGADARPLAQEDGRRQRLPVVPVPSVQGRQHQDSDAHRSRSERPSGRPSGVRTDSRGHEGKGDRPRIHVVPRRRTRVRKAGELDQVRFGGGEVHGQTRRGPRRVTPAKIGRTPRSLERFRRRFRSQPPKRGSAAKALRSAGPAGDANLTGNLERAEKSDSGMVPARERRHRFSARQFEFGVELQ
ncbi:MAG: alpha/beta hydrolase family protein, partial [Acidimicrobiia bacterium]